MLRDCHIVSTNTNSREYHSTRIAKRGDPSHVVSSSTLIEFARNPSRWMAKGEDDPSDAMAWGNLVDCLLLIPAHFESIYSLEPASYPAKNGEAKPWSNNADFCREWRQSQEEDGKEVVKLEQVNRAKLAVERIKSDPVLSPFLAASETQVHVAGEWHDESTKLVVPVSCLIDLVPGASTEFGKCLGDFKTTASAEIMSWERWAKRARYHVQAAWNADLYRAAKPDEDRNTFCFLLSESYPPYSVGRRMMSDGGDASDLFGIGRSFYTRIMRAYCRCLKTGIWPTVDDMNRENVQGWTVLRANEWDAYPEMSAAQEDDADAPEASDDIIP